MLKYRADLDGMFAALADPTRRSIVDRLSQGPASVSELARPLPISLPAVVQHVQVLQATGLVNTRKVGRTRLCELEPTGVGQVEGWLHERRIFWQRRLDRLGRFLDDEAAHPAQAGHPDPAQADDPAHAGHPAQADDLAQARDPAQEENHVRDH